MDRIKLAEEILSALGGEDGLRSLGGKRLQAVDGGVVFEVQRDGLWAFVYIGSAGGQWWNLYARMIYAPHNSYHRQGLERGELLAALEEVLRLG